jgi:hypothetical protein
MDTLDKYRDIIEGIIREYASIPYSYGKIERRSILDRTGDHYLLMIDGWEGLRRVHGCVMHMDIINGKIWIQRDGTEEGVAVELEKAGVPKDHIVLAFKSPRMRPHTGYAVA